jgi:hypothetical protein
VATCTQLVTIVPQNVLVVNNSTMPLYSNDQINLEITSPTGGSSYAWAGPGGLSSSAEDLIEIVTSGNSGIYTATVTDALGCTNSTTISITINASVVLQLKALLSGPYSTSTSLMHDSLRSLNLIPTIEPYSNVLYAPIFTHHATNSNAGMACTNSSLLGSSSATIGGDAIVDWVFVQLRSGADSNIVLASRSALIQRDGDVVREDGIRPITFQGIVAGNYFISIKHRTHLGMMNLVPITLTEAGTPLFSRASPNNNISPLTGATRIMGGKRAMYTGNCNIASTLWSRYIAYNNTLSSDRTSMIAATGGSGTILGYSIFDIDMNGYARFNGLNPDRLVMLQNCAGSSIIYVHEQTPN